MSQRGDGRGEGRRISWKGLYEILFHDISQYMMYIMIRNAKNVRLDRIASRIE